ncbi:hypothetical protein RF11_07178 [Thelohanellus kitauei]|uniref:Uncharacterized protein n=1 Tax=Thelohanellus kitauei TaxID=669202 RepID=A0A0C2ND71_THEKT|nr:hypothetical protein RF11_07178 [Thelohanellus kitauei]
MAYRGAKCRAVDQCIVPTSQGRVKDNSEFVSVRPLLASNLLTFHLGSLGHSSIVYQVGRMRKHVLAGYRGPDGFVPDLLSKTSDSQINLQSSVTHDNLYKKGIADLKYCVHFCRKVVLNAKRPNYSKIIMQNSAA